MPAADRPLTKKFDVQGHRGSRGLKPENTLPAVEAALDLMVTTLEVDLHLSQDGVPIVFHDEAIDKRLVTAIPGATVPDPAQRPLISRLTARQLSGYRVDRNPDANRFHKQNPAPTPVARAFAAQKQMDPLTIPTVADLFAFVAAYAGELGANAGKNVAQRERAAGVRFSLELKRVPFHPEFIGDGFDGSSAGQFEKAVVNLVRNAKVENRTIVQSFDHRAIRIARELEPKLQSAVLIANTAPAAIDRLVKDAHAQIYSPDYAFLDQRQIRQAHDAGIRVIPWTVNQPGEMHRLIEWGVDGIITDFPDLLVWILRERKIEF